MALARQQSVVTYTSSSGGATYTFDIVMNAQGGLSVRNIRGPKGLITDPYTIIPSSVLDDIEEAKKEVQQVMDETQVDSGTLTFTGETTQTALIASGVLNNTAYRVVYSTPDGTILRTENQTTTSFDAVAPTTYGSVVNPIVVGYVVLVATQQASATSGTLTFTAGQSSQAVAFTETFATADYRVMLSPEGFFVARVVSPTRAGFTVQLPFTVPAGHTVLVGYDVFI